MDTQNFQSNADLANRRTAPRGKMFKGAHIRFNKGYSAYEAIVRDISPSGVRLRFGEMVELPPVFDLRVGNDGAYHEAHVAWQRGLEIGVAFSS